MIWDKRLHPHSLSFPGNLSHFFIPSGMLCSWPLLRDKTGTQEGPVQPHLFLHRTISEPSEGDTGYKKREEEG